VAEKDMKVPSNVKGWNGERGAQPKPEVSKGACPHGKRPWWDCAECSKTKTYSFRGNFR